MAKLIQRRALGGLYGVLLSIASIHAQDGAAREVHSAVSEYQVKAAFLLNFVKFIEWPQPDGAHARNPFAICVMGDDPFGSTLEQMMEGEAVNGRPLGVFRVRRWREACNVLFVSKTEGDASAVLKEVGPGVLTVGESADFLRNGGMINFVLDGRRVRFDVSQSAAERGSVKISSRLLSVAKSVVK